MPPVQEQLLLTDTEQTSDQGVQGLRKKKTTLLEDYSPTNQGTSSLEPPYVACMGQNKQGPYNTEVGIPRRFSGDSGDE